MTEKLEKALERIRKEIYNSNYYINYGFSIEKIVEGIGYVNTLFDNGVLEIKKRHSSYKIHIDEFGDNSQNLLAEFILKEFTTVDEVTKIISQDAEHLSSFNVYLSDDNAILEFKTNRKIDYNYPYRHIELQRDIIVSRLNSYGYETKDYHGELASIFIPKKEIKKEKKGFLEKIFS